MEEGTYLIDNGYLLIMYIKKNIELKMLNSFFNVEEISQIQSPIIEVKFYSL